MLVVSVNDLTVRAESEETNSLLVATKESSSAAIRYHLCNKFKHYICQEVFREPGFSVFRIEVFVFHEFQSKRGYLAKSI